MPLNKLTYNGRTYADEIVAGAGGLNMDHSMVGETLAVDTLTVPLITGNTPIRFLAGNQGPNDFFKTGDGKIFCTSKGATPQFVKNAAGLFYFDDTLVGKYYLNELKRTGPDERVLRFLSAIRLLDQSDHVGGLYTGETAGEVIADIIGNVVAYSIDGDIAAIQVYGYLPYARRRANLQMVLMAITAAAKNASDGSLRITQLSGVSAGVFDASRVFIGGEVVDRIAATAVQVVEHNHLPSSETVKLFDDSTLGTETVIFREPYHDLTITGGAIVASGVNFCTFSASGAVVLEGKKYNHVTRVITAGTTPTGADSDAVKAVRDNTLLTPNNAAIVAEKLFEYLSVAQSIKQEVVFGTERPGDVVSVINPYTSEMVSACIKSMDIAFGSCELRAVCEFIAGYVPPGATAGFQHYVVLTGTGTWIVPAGVTRIRAIVVGGGDGGVGGNNGATSVAGVNLPLNGGAGGPAGTAGQGAFIFEINLIVTPAVEYSYDCGIGGAGGSPGAAGTAGEATTFGSLSSAVGKKYPYGYSEPKSAMTIAAEGNSGVAGAPGQNYNEEGAFLTYDDVTYTSGAKGDDVYSSYSTNPGWARGGGGGGPAVGNNGSSGMPGVLEYHNIVGGPYGVYEGYWLYHGRGGYGANAVNRAAAANYGQGGDGGHGGGGGGYVVGDIPGIFDLPGDYFQRPATGGTGGAGGAGGPGVIVIYY